MVLVYYYNECFWLSPSSAGSVYIQNVHTSKYLYDNAARGSVLFSSTPSLGEEWIIMDNPLTHTTITTVTATTVTTVTTKEINPVRWEEAGLSGVNTR